MSIIVEPFSPDLVTADRYVGLVMLDPAGARHLLGFNTKNRKVRQSRVAQYADAITDGRWGITPDAVAVEAGDLVNGQHRCRAIISAGQAVPVLFTANIGATFDITDNGASRTAADVLFLAGLSDYPGALAAASKLYLRECGVAFQTLADNRYIERWVIEHAELEGWVSHYERLARASGDPLARVFSTPATVLSYAVERAEYRVIIGAAHGAQGTRTERVLPTDRESLTDFGHQLLTGLGLEDSADPVYVLRTQVARMQEDKRLTSKITNPVVLDLVTKAFHARVQNKRPTRFKVGSVGEWPYGIQQVM
jgi:hypothetical protein